MDDGDGHFEVQDFKDFNLTYNFDLITFLVLAITIWDTYTLLAYFQYLP